MTNEHPLPLCVSPLGAYDLAGRSMDREIRDLGASEAARRYAPRRIYGGWHSPLFDVVLRTPEVNRAR